MYVECGMKLVYFQLMSWPAAGDTHVDRSKGGVEILTKKVGKNKFIRFFFLACVVNF